MQHLAYPGTRKWPMIAAAVAAVLFTDVNVFAGPGIAPVYSKNAAPPPAAPDIAAPTYYVNSPLGLRPDLIGGAGAPGINTGVAMRKFVDTLPGVAGWAPTTNIGTGNIGGVAPKYIPVAVPKTWPADGADYYHLAIVEATEPLHTDLPKATTLRLYVQIEEPGETPTPVGSLHVPLYYPNGTAITLPDANGVQQPVYGYDTPHYDGPIVTSTRNKPVRIKYSNLLPVGGALDVFGNGVPGRNGDLFLPVDATLPGGALQQNRIDIHLHGGVTPWISDGNPHQWTIPVGDPRFGLVTEAAITNAGAGYSAAPVVAIDAPQSVAVATATVGSTATAVGAVTALNVSNAGAFYTAATPPAVTLAAPPGLAAGAAAPVAASATATVASGKVATISVPAGGGGIGYPIAPTPVVSAPTPSVNATATATLGVAGANGATVTGLVLGVATPNVGYATAPAVTIAAPAPAVAAKPALAVVASNGSLSLSNPANFGYWTAPAAPALPAPNAAVNATVTGATLSANAVTGSPQLATITGLNAGNFGYWPGTNPVVTIAAPAYTPTQATVTNNLKISTTRGAATGTVLASAGNAGYWLKVPSSNPASVVSVSAPPANVQANGTATVGPNGTITAITLGAAGQGYFSGAGTVTATLPAPAAAVTATASATLNAGSLTIAVGNAATNWGYFTAPVVTLSGGTHGAGTLTATATVSNGRVTAIAYTGTAVWSAAPTVSVAAAPASATGRISVIAATGSVPAVSTAVAPTGSYTRLSSAGAGYAPNTTIPITFSAPNIVPATAVVTPTIGTGVNAGRIIGLVLSGGGAGYVTPPVVSIVAPVANQTASAALVMSNGKITGFTLSGGANYTTVPKVTISAAAKGTQATLTATVDGLGHLSYALANPGTGYATAPALAAPAPVASVTATATASINASGSVTGFTVTKAGTNYVPGSLPAVTVGNATLAVPATATATLNPATGSVTGYTVTNAGFGYWTPPTVTLAAPPTPIQATATANVAADGSIGGFTITNPGQGYNLPPSVTVAWPAAAVQATASATTTAGALSSVVITNPGGGYTATPGFTITDASGKGGVINGLVSAPVGPSFRNVPDMVGNLAASQAPAFYVPPATGEGTLYYTNQQTGRIMWYHDHTSALTRLNVYAGLAAPYLIQDPAIDPVLPNAVPVAGAPVPALQGLVPAETIPLVFQDKTFVPQDVNLQDAYWDQAHWGTYGDLWFPHVYETNQNPSLLRNLSNLGRWDWGPWFAIVYPAQFALPTGQYGDVTTTPEAFQDTIVVNGAAFPTITVEPRAYRLRMLNAANDRFMNLGFYLADPAQVSSDGRPNTEVKTGPAGTAQPGTVAGAAANVFQSSVTNQGYTPWPTDGRTVPMPTEMGPPMFQFANDGGLLPNWVESDPIPVNFDYNRRSVTVLNVSQNNDFTQLCYPECHGMYLGPAERADVVVDFSHYAGKTLILYNDAPSPNPGYDSRIDYYTNDDPVYPGTINYANGGAPNTAVGFGPNTRTMMQVVVGTVQNAAGTHPIDYTAAISATPATYIDPVTGAQSSLQAWDPNALGAGKVLGALTTTARGPLQTLYAATQAAPIVGESAYNNALNQSYVDQYGGMHLASADQPVFYVTDPGPLTLTGVTLVGTTANVNPSGVATNGTNPNMGKGVGTGYTVAPTVVLSPPNCVAGPTCVQATATATVANGQVTGVTLNNVGAGYTEVPFVNFVSSGNLTTISVSNGGAGYSPASPPVVTLTGGGAGAAGTPPAVPATAVATVSAAGVVTGITITTPGSGYAVAPTVTIAAPSVGTGASASAALSATGTVASLTLGAGGTGYTVVPAVSIQAPAASVPAAATAAVPVAGGGITLTTTSVGTNYSVAPNVTISAPPSATATATDTTTFPGYGAGTYAGLVLNAITVTGGGAGYAAAPAVTITDLGGTGTGAAATATVSNGVVTGISVTAVGSGYKGPLAIGVAPPAGPFTPAKATATVVTPGAVQLTLSNPGSGYVVAPSVTIDPPPVATQATATATVANGAVTGLTLTGAGSGYTTPPQVTLSNPAATNATAIAAVTGGGYGAEAVAVASTTKVFAVPTTAPQAANSVPFTLPALPPGGVVGRLMNPAIQELFEPYYGRMNATLGIEMPYQSLAVQTTVPLNFVDPDTETMEPNTVQMWKITHNGVDAHPVHFHLVNVQVVNRVGWDGTVKPPEDNEIGWKETVKMNPLEDVIVAMKAVLPQVPFGVDHSVRLDDPSQPLGVPGGFTQFSTLGLNGQLGTGAAAVYPPSMVPVATAAAPGVGQPATIVNSIENYDNEYIWHCHLLGHEENDFMRPFVFTTSPTVPAAATVTAVGQAAAAGAITVSWTDPTPTGAQASVPATYGNPANELGFLLQRSTSPNGPWLTVAKAPANAVSAVDLQYSPTTAGVQYYYQVVGYNVAGNGPGSSQSVASSIVAK